jgi:hypothetical protein
MRVNVVNARFDCTYNFKGVESVDENKDSFIIYFKDGRVFHVMKSNLLLLGTGEEEE